MTPLFRSRKSSKTYEYREFRLAANSNRESNVKPTWRLHDLSRSKDWIINYLIAGNRDRAMINEAVGEYHKLTCVKWVQRTGAERDYVYFTSGNTGCWSSVGRIGGRQEINLQSPGCLTKKGTVIHEMMHALGFLHEQNRWERDKHVIVNYGNIQSGMSLHRSRKSLWSRVKPDICHWTRRLRLLWK